MLEPPHGYFHLSFMGKTASRYRSAFSFRSGLLQQDIVCSYLHDNPDRMQEAKDSMVDNPTFRIFQENPLHLGFYLDSIGTGDLLCNSLSAL